MSEVITSTQSEVKTESTKTFTRCPVCDGALHYGSRDPCEGDYYYCEACGNGPICFPLYEGPKPEKKIAAIIDAEEFQRVLRSIREVPVPGYIPPSPHSYLDPVLSDKKLDTVKDRLVVDQKLSEGQLCDGRSEQSDCWIADEAAALTRCGKLNQMRARAMR